MFAYHTHILNIYKISRLSKKYTDVCFLKTFQETHSVTFVKVLPWQVRHVAYLANLI